MTRSAAFLALALTLVAHTALAQPERKDLQVANDVADAVNRYAFFTVFDDVNANVNQGVVTLTGKVTQPFKSDDIERRIAKVPGITRIVNRMSALPVSQFDDELRFRIARAIYGNANFWNYSAMANPPIHIIVERGRVTLTGVVQSEVDRMLARTLATQFGAMSIKNELKTVAEVRDAIEES